MKNFKKFVYSIYESKQKSEKQKGKFVCLKISGFQILE